MTETLTALDGTPPAVEEPLPASSAKKWVYEFAEGSRQMRTLLGGKGAGIAEAGVGELVRIAVDRGRRARTDLELGVCGEHRADPGDPASIRFFHEAGLDYVSCSPFRLPIARVAAAQAAIAAPRNS